MIYMDYWWITLLLMVVGLAVLLLEMVHLILRNKRLKNENESLKSRLRETELNLSIVSDWHSGDEMHKFSESQGYQTAGRRVPYPLEDEIISRAVDLHEGAGTGDSDGSFLSGKREVRLRKILGEGNKIRLGASYEGIEEMPPQVGQSYRVFTGLDKVLITSPVVHVEPGYIKTANSFYKIEVLGNGSGLVDFDTLWDRIEKHQGQVFKTRTGIQFTYQIDSDILQTDKTNQGLSKSDFAQAYRLISSRSLDHIKEKIHGPAYVWAILKDRRISQGRE